MKRLAILSILTVLKGSCAFGQCSSLFSFAAYSETVTFINQSTVSNAHYFWNFGDGTGSNIANPVHKFPETGSYLVTLFAKDTVNNCASFYEYWVNLTKYSMDVCQTSISDSIFAYSGDYFLKIIDNSNNCNSYYGNYDGGPAQNFPAHNWIWLGWGWHHARFLSRVRYFDSGNNIKREAYKTSLFKYTSAKNYGNCSANFEFKVVSQDTGGQRILFTAMNRSATVFEWEVMGLGNPIVSHSDTISQYYPFAFNSLWIVGLNTVGSNGCKDTLYQNILIEKNIETMVSVKENELKDLSLNAYPNPFVESITIQSDKSELIIDQIQITDLTGRLILSFDKVIVNRPLLIGEIPKGIYFAEAKCGLYFKVFKLIKE